jgi:agmatinase
MKEKSPIPDDYAFHWSFLALNNDELNFESSRIVVLPVPYDSTTSYRSGAKEGPRAIIEASRYLEDYDLELDCEISDVGIYTLPELDPNVDGPYKMTERVKNVSKAIFESGKILAVLGGEHSISLGAISAAAEMYENLSVLYLDAHGDLRDMYMGSRYSHACTARRVLEIAPVVEVGVRSISKEEIKFYDSSKSKNLDIYFYERTASAESWNVNEVLEKLSENVYISLDLDVLDPSIMSAVGTPEPGGIDWDKITELMITVCRGRNVVGFDIVELCPPAGPSSCAFIAAKLAYKIMGYITSINHKR